MLRQRYPRTVRLDASGAGSVSFTARGDFLLTRYRVVVVTAAGLAPTNQSQATIEINGDDFDGSFTGNNDAGDCSHLMVAGDELVCAWSGGDALASATLTLWGMEYDAGTGIASVYGPTSR